MKLKIVFCFLCAMILMGQTAGAENAMPLEDFVMQDYLRGIPCRQAAEYGVESVDKLTFMLNDESRQPYWENIVVTLGCIGGDAAFETISDFLEAHQGTVSFDTFAALQGVSTALGVLTNNGNEEALQLLSEIAQDDYWKQAKLKIIDDAVKEHIVHQSLMRSTIVALGYTGRSEAAEILNQLKKDPGFAQEYQAELDMVLGQ